MAEEVSLKKLLNGPDLLHMSRRAKHISCLVGFAKVTKILG